MKMKQTLALLLTLIMCLSLCACNSSAENDSQANTSESTNSTAADNEVENSVVLAVGEKAHGDICDVTITSVECVDKIENGLEFSMWSPANQTSYEDVFADDGYSIIMIEYHVDYAGKATGRFSLDFELDYDDGYIFTPNTNNLVPATESGVGFEKTYTFSTDNSITVEDALSYKGEDAVTYVVVNDVALTDTDKPFVLRVGIPTEPDTQKTDSYGILTYVQGNAETFTFDLRTVELTISSEAGNKRFEKTGTVVGMNNGLPSLNEIYGDNSWAIKYGDNPVRETVFFREDVDVSAYIGEEITFSFVYGDGDNHPVDAYIVE